MSQEKLNHVVCGVLVDFMAWLMECPLRRASIQNNPILSYVFIDTFLNEREVKAAYPFNQWADRCDRILLETMPAESLVLMPPVNSEISVSPKEKTSENLRDEFAMAALGALAHDQVYARAHPEKLAKYAFEIADAMMKKRGE